MTTPDFAQIIEESWEQRDQLSSKTTGAARVAVEAALEGLDRGEFRIAEKQADGWVVHQWLKKAVLLSFRLNDSAPMHGGYDKVPLKWTGWSADQFAAAGFRAVPGAVVRHSAYIAPGVVLMPSFVNVGAHVAKGTMIDTWATVGSCAQIGANCHI
jgi:2,3,4,5-tetrahydropyridine-2-carboxylate N-succinyltransferase